MDLGSGVEDQKTFMQNILLRLKSNPVLVNLLDILESKCSGIQGSLLEQIEIENPEENNSENAIEAPKNLKLSFSKIGKRVAKILAKAIVVPLCLVAVPIIDLLLLPSLIRNSNLIIGILQYSSGTVMMTGICIVASFEIINDFSGFKKEFVKEYKDKSLSEILPSRQTIKDIFLGRN